MKQLSQTQLKPEYSKWVSKWIPITGGIATVLLAAGSVTVFRLTKQTTWLGLALIVLALSLFPLPQIVLLTVAVAMASPTATMGTIFAIRYDRNAVYASELFAVTTILSAVSLPLVVFLAERLL